MRPLLLLLGISFPTYASSQSRGEAIALTIDVGNAAATLRLLEHPDAPVVDWNRFFALDGTQALLGRMERWGEDPSEGRLMELLREASRGASNVPMSFSAVVRDSTTIRTLMNRLRDETQGIQGFVNQRLSRFLEEEDRLEINVVLVLGGGSAGFTRGGAKNQFIGLHFYDGDFLGVRNLILHESFHNVQAAFSPQLPAMCLSPAEEHTYSLLSRIFQEGTAEFVADIWDYDPAEAPYIAKLQDHLAVNRNPYRRKQIEGLIELVGGPVGAQLSGRAESPWNILFGWNWRNPGYQYGYTMSQLLYGPEGRSDLRVHLRSHPTRFFLDYVDISQDGGLQPFSQGFVSRITAIEAKLGQC